MSLRVEERKLARFIEGIRRGMKIKHACYYGGFNPKTFYDWKIRAAEDPDGSEAAFLVRWREAEAEHVSEHLTNVSEAGATDWRASMRLLSHHGYTETKGVELSGPGGGAVEVRFNLEGMTVAELEKVQEDLKD